LRADVPLNLLWQSQLQLTGYVLQVMVNKNVLQIPLTLTETQIIRHFMPKVIDYLHQANFEKICSMLQQPKLSAPETDFLLPEYCAYLQSKKNAVFTASSRFGLFSARAQASLPTSSSSTTDAQYESNEIAPRLN